MGIFSSKQLCKNEACEDFIKRVTKESCIVMFVKDTCPFCARAKQVFDKLAMPYCAISLTEKTNGKEMQETLGKMTGASTVPRVFVNGSFVGGGDDVERLMTDGKLMKLIKECAPGLLKSTCAAPEAGDALRNKYFNKK